MDMTTLALEKGEVARLRELTGVSFTHLHFVLRGERIPSLELARAIAAYLGERTPASVLAVLAPAPVPAGAAADTERVLVPGVDVPEEGEAAV
jgi:hypothetical protein